MTGHGHASRGDRLIRATSRIRADEVAGKVWSGWTEGMTVTGRDTGAKGKTTELQGTLAGQTALIGVLERLDSHGARLAALECLDAEDVDGNAPGPVVDRWL